MKALIIVDVQNDFLPGGALAVAEGDQIVPMINRLMDHYDLVVATQDWHPPGHGSFAANHPGKNPGDIIELGGLPQVLWPTHCVAGTRGAEFSPALKAIAIDRVFRKGQTPGVDSYSGLFDNGHRQSTGLGEFLKDLKVSEVEVCGLATDYCVKFTAMDARQMGFAVRFIADASRGVNLQPGDVEAAIEQMRSAGVTVASLEEILREPIVHRAP